MFSKNLKTITLLPTFIFCASKIFRAISEDSTRESKVLRKVGNFSKSS